jgi:hypothetical protein
MLDYDDRLALQSQKLGFKNNNFKICDFEKRKF